MNMQPTFYPPDIPSFKIMSLQFRDKNVVKDHIKKDRLQKFRYIILSTNAVTPWETPDC